MAIYYVSNSGNDNNDGLSINSPWRTINKVNNFFLLPNDTVCFKCGDYWREQLVPKGGNSSANITYTKYGTGALPLFMGSAKANVSTDWVNAGTNLWKNTAWWTAANALQSDVGNIIVDGEICGWKYFDLGSLKKQLDYFCDHTDNYSVTMYSTKNPATLYSMVELAFFRDIIHNDQIPYITIDSLELKYGGSHGYGGVGQWGGGNNVHHIKVLNCVIHHMGGGSDTDTMRLGNAVQFYAGANDCLVQGNHIYQIYDSGCTNQSGSDNSSEYNITYTNNIIDTCEMSFEYWMSGANNVMHDINFVDNVCTNAGKGWAHIQRPDKIGTHVMEWGNVANQYNINITGNTFDTATEQLIYSWHVDQLYPVHYDKNNYVQPTNDASHTYLLFQSALASDITINNYVDWIIRYNQDQNSTFNGKTLIINMAIKLGQQSAKG